MSDKTRINQLDLNLLRVLKTLYVEQNMTRTADILHLTPSAISHAVKRLRYALGDELFIRSQNKMLPTPTCQRVAPQIIDALNRLQQGLLEWGGFDPATSEHHFKIGLHDSLEPTLIPQLEKLISRLAPKVSFSSVAVNRANIHKELAVGKIDIAVDTATSVKTPIRRKNLLKAEFVVMMRKDHPLINILSKDTYSTAQHIAVSNRPTGFTGEDILLNEQGISRDIRLRCQSYYGAKEVVRQSNKLLTLAKPIALRLLDDNLVLRPIPYNMKSFPTSLYWHEQSESDQAVSWLRELMLNKIVLD